MVLFDNQGNDCYLNSVLQVLLNVVPFEYFFNQCVTNEHSPPIIKLFKSLVSHSRENVVVKPRIIKHELAKHRDYLFANFEQQDAHEAIVAILDIIHEATKDQKLFEKVAKNYSKRMDNPEIQKSFAAWKKSAEIFGYSFITEYFTGQFKTITVCEKKSCDYQNTSYDNFNNLTLQIPKSGSPVTDCLSDFVKSEKTEGSKCEKCSQSLWKRSTIWKFPPVLILSLKRFRYIPQISNYGRISDDVEIEPIIQFKSNGVLYEYHLTSLINHHGGNPHSGHYTARANKENEWVMLDDDRSYKTGLETTSKSVYLLSYYIHKAVPV